MELGLNHEPLFFLTPKQDVLYIYEDFTLRQTLEKIGPTSATPPSLF